MTRNTKGLIGHCAIFSNSDFVENPPFYIEGGLDDIIQTEMLPTNRIIFSIGPFQSFDAASAILRTIRTGIPISAFDGLKKEPTDFNSYYWATWPCEYSIE